MNAIADFHTHHRQAAHALISVGVREFAPQPGKCYSVGIHPWSVPESNDDDLGFLTEAVSHPQVLAVGETGLDSLRGGPLQRQQQFFERHIALAEQAGKPLVVHCVRTAQQVVALWRTTAPHNVRLAIHGFRGNERVAQTLLNEGFYLSFGARFNASAVVVTPIDRLLIETDDAADGIECVAQAVAQAKGISVQELMHISAANAASFLGLI